MPWNLFQRTFNIERFDINDRLATVHNMGNRLPIRLYNNIIVNGMTSIIKSQIKKHLLKHSIWVSLMSSNLIQMHKRSSSLSCCCTCFLLLLLLIAHITRLCRLMLLVCLLFPVFTKSLRVFFHATCLMMLHYFVSDYTVWSIFKRDQVFETGNMCIT